MISTIVWATYGCGIIGISLFTVGIVWNLCQYREFDVSCTEGNILESMLIQIPTTVENILESVSIYRVFFLKPTIVGNITEYVSFSR